MLHHRLFHIPKRQVISYHIQSLSQDFKNGCPKSLPVQIWVAAYLLQTLIPTTFHSLLCHLMGIYTSAMMVCKELFGYYPPKVEIKNTLQEFLPVQKRGFQETVCPKDNQNGSWPSP